MLVIRMQRSAIFVHCAPLILRQSLPATRLAATMFALQIDKVIDINQITLAGLPRAAQRGSRWPARACHLSISMCAASSSRSS